MKKLSLFNKIIFFFNIVVAVLTLIAYMLPFLAPELFPFLTVFTLFMPLLLVLSAFFFLYWLVQTKRQMLLSGLILLLGITFITRFYSFSSSDKAEDAADFTLMSYNVRMFNLYGWLPDADIPEKIMTFVKAEDPDILCLQEYTKRANVSFPIYKYKFIYGKDYKAGQGIFSKYPIINTGCIEFPDTGNNVVFADILKVKDTFRVYSIHFQSIKISQDIHEQIDGEKSKVIFNRISSAFKQQQFQSELLEQHKSQCGYPMVICGDLNNSAFSYVYREVKGNLNDAFEEAGGGFGISYNYAYYPARIDYIFSNKDLEVKEFTTFNKFIGSDHFPIMSRMAFGTKE